MQHSSRKLKVKQHLRDLRRRREDNTKMAVVYLARDVAVGAFVSTVINFQIVWCVCVCYMDS
jgi:hypothetical protein